MVFFSFQSDTSAVDEFTRGQVYGNLKTAEQMEGDGQGSTVSAQMAFAPSVLSLSLSSCHGSFQEAEQVKGWREGGRGGRGAG